MKHKFEQIPASAENKINHEEARRIAEECIDAETIAAILETDIFRKEFVKGEEGIMSLARLVIELRDKAQDYSAILSDEASGRLPSLFLKKVFDNERKKAGMDPIKTFFIVGGRHSQEEVSAKVKNFLEKKKNELGKVLLVTEFIQSGNSIRVLMKILDDCGVDFDLASVSIDENYESQNGDLVENAYYGSLGRGGLAFYSRYDYTGVSKEPLKSPHPKRSPFLHGEYVRKAREDMAFLAETIVESLDKHKTRD